MNIMTRRAFAIALATLLVAPAFVRAADTAPPKGQRVYSIGHSFHMFMPGILAQIAKSAGIEGHLQVGASGIGGSHVIQHWDVADDKYKSKEIIGGTGKLDVLTMAPIYLPDEGIENFIKLASEKNPDIRVFVQEFWLPYDQNIDFKRPPKDKKLLPPNRDEYDGKKLRADHEAYFKTIDEHVEMLREKYHNKPKLFVAPVGQAVLALREAINEGTAPGLTKQTDLFTDAIGHAKPPLTVLVAYVYYALIYDRNPVGLPVPPSLKGTFNDETTEKLNRLLQELAWAAATSHPLSGVD